jgi:hypothetical protein
MRDRPVALAEGLLAVAGGEIDSEDAQAAAQHVAEVLVYLLRYLTRG